MKLDQKKAKSILASFSVTSDVNDLNEENLTVGSLVEIVPKEIAADTAVTLTVGGTVYETERNGDVFTADIDLPIFPERSGEANVRIRISSGGVDKIEVLTSDDTDLFPLLDSFVSANWVSYFPHFSSRETVLGHRTVPELKKGAFSIDIWENAYVETSGCSLVGCTMALYDGDRVLLEQDLTEQMLSAGSKESFLIKWEGSWKDIQSEYVRAVLTLTDSRGYTYSTYDYYFAECEERALPYVSITNAAGNVIWEE